MTESDDAFTVTLKVTNTGKTYSGKETVQVIDTSEWMGRSYELIAVLYTHKPTGFQFTNYCIRPAGIISSSSRHDLLLYDWAEHQAGADSY